MARDALILRGEDGSEHKVEVGDASVSVDGEAIDVAGVRDGEVRAGERHLWIARQGDTRWVFADGQVFTFTVERATGRRRGPRHDGGLAAPMPATIVRMAVAPGDRVRAGDVVVVLEAMKMELPIRAPIDGVVVSVHGRQGELVQPGHDLVQIAPDTTETA